MRFSILSVALLVVGSTAHAQGRVSVLRIATVVPKGTAWAREFSAWGNDVDLESQGALKVKIYFSGIAGSEPEELSRIQRGQLDGTVAGTLCMRLAPTMRVSRVIGLLQTRAEAAYVLSRLQSQIDAELRQNGFVSLGIAGMGVDVILSRKPIQTMDDLRHARLWLWNQDEVGVMMWKQMGFPTSTVPLTEAARAFDEGRIDGWVALPAAALAFQWVPRAHYAVDPHMSHMTGCVLMATRTFDRLSIEQQQILRTSGAKLAARVEVVEDQQDRQLLGGLFQKQGMKVLHADEDFRTQLLSAARIARENLAGKLVPPALMRRVLAILADYRAEHQRREATP